MTNEWIAHQSQRPLPLWQCKEIQEMLFGAPAGSGSITSLSQTPLAESTDENE
jgi:hypothetical protein